MSKANADSRFPLYWAKTLQEGRVFAEASMGFLGSVTYKISGDVITVKTSTNYPLLASLGCQMAAWTREKLLISGPVRWLAKRPAAIYEGIATEKSSRNWPAGGEVPPIACVEGCSQEGIEEDMERIKSELQGAGIKKAEIICIIHGSEAQIINILSRAIEVALLRLSLLTPLNNLKIKEALSTVKANYNSEDIENEMNDAIRLYSHVTLLGDFHGFKNFGPIITANSIFRDQSFAEVVRKYKSIAKCPLELFSVKKLTVMDREKTWVFE